MTNRPRVAWPDGKAFAFTIFDDTDLATLERVVPVYSFLEEIGLRTTKSVWPLRGDEAPRIDGVTCEDPEYAAWTLELQRRGFEIGYHGASNVTAPRALAMRSLSRFNELYGHPPRSMANHSGCAEGIYWGPDRVSGAHRLLYNLLTRFRNVGVHRGHVEGDPLFWGDLCREQVEYVRNFTFTDINTLAACPTMPYHDPERPYANAWFASSEGAEVNAFNRCISEENQDRLEAEGGACIMYTHLASGFFGGGALDPRFEQLMRRLAAKNGWFVPVSTLLDHLRREGRSATIGRAERNALERRWLWSKLRVGST